MEATLRKILDWSEVWALLIPLTVLLWKKNRTVFLKPVRIYVIAALLINLFIDVIADYKGKWGLTPEDLLWNNNFLYNISSVMRLLLFAWMFLLFRQKFMLRLKQFIPVIFIVFLLINFIFFEPFIPRGDYEGFSSRLLATESALLLFYCLQYFIYMIMEDRTNPLSKQKGFWVVTGLSIYAAVNFFIFLFYYYLIGATRHFAVSIWDVHNIVFILFCIFIAIQFARKNE